MTARGVRRAGVQGPDKLTGHGPTPRGHEQCIAGGTPQQLRSRLRDVARDPLAGHLAQGHQTLLAPFADHPPRATHKRNRHPRQAPKLEHPKARGIERLGHGPNAQTQRSFDIRRVEQGFGLGLGQSLGKALGLAGCEQSHGRVVGAKALAQQPAKVAPEHREAPIAAAGARIGMTGRDVGLQISLLGGFQSSAAGVQPAGQQREVTPVGRQRVGRQAVLEPQGIAKALYR